MGWHTVPSSGGAAAFMGAYVRRTTDQSIATGVETAMSWNAEVYDTDAIHDNAVNPSRLTVPSTGAGKWQVQGFARLSTISDGVRFYGLLKVNGADPTPTPYFQASSARTNSFPSVYIGAPLALNAGDYLEFFLWHETGANRDVFSTHSGFAMHRLGA